MLQYIWFYFIVFVALGTNTESIIPKGTLFNWTFQITKIKSNKFSTAKRFTWIPNKSFCHQCHCFIILHIRFHESDCLPFPIWNSVLVFHPTQNHTWITKTTERLVKQLRAEVYMFLCSKYVRKSLAAKQAHTRMNSRLLQDTESFWHS